MSLPLLPPALAPTNELKKKTIFAFVFIGSLGTKRRRGGEGRRGERRGEGRGRRGEERRGGRGEDRGGEERKGKRIKEKVQVS